MRLENKLIACLCISCAFAFVACSDDSGTTPDKGVADKGVADKGTGDMAASDTSAADSAGSDGSSTGACQSASDQTGVQKSWGTPPKTISELMAQPTCLAQTGDAQKKCIKDIAQPIIGSDVSEMCLDCYIAAAVCAVANGCAAKCLSDPNAQACIDCRCGKDKTGDTNCIEEFKTCAGPVPNTTQCS